MLHRPAIHGPGAMTTVSHVSRPSLVASASTPPSPRSKPTTSTPSRISTPAPRARSARRRTVCIASAQPPRRSCRIPASPPSPARVQDRRDRRLPVRPGPAQVLAAALGADHELGCVAHALVLLADGHQVVDLLLGDRGEVADLAEAVGVGL